MLTCTLHPRSARSSTCLTGRHSNNATPFSPPPWSAGPHPPSVAAGMPRHPCFVLEIVGSCNTDHCVAVTGRVQPFSPGFMVMMRTLRLIGRLTRRSSNLQGGLIHKPLFIEIRRLDPYCVVNEWMKLLYTNHYRMDLTNALCDISIVECSAS
jgi:hypothetical protein